MVDFGKLKTKKDAAYTTEPDGSLGVDLASSGSSDSTAIAPLPAAIDFDQLQRDGASAALQATTKDMAIPFLRVLQSNSPQVDRDNAKYVKGSESGMFINTVTGRLWEGREQGVLVAVIAYQRSYTEWNPRGEQGQSGGFVKDWGSDDSKYKQAVPHPDKKSKMMTPDGTEMVQSGNYFVYVVDPETGMYEQMVLPLSGTQLKKSRRWNSLIKSEQVVHPVTGQPFTPPPFFRLYRLTTVPEQNDKGNWKGLKIETGPTLFEVPNGGLIYKEAMAFKQAIDAGDVKVAPPEYDAETGKAGGAIADDEDAPF